MCYNGEYGYITYLKYVQGDEIMDEDRNVDYKEMYLTLLRVTEKAMELLITAQRECEELYIEAVEHQPKSIV